MSSNRDIAMGVAAAAIIAAGSIVAATHTNSSGSTHHAQAGKHIDKTRSAAPTTAPTATQASIQKPHGWVRRGLHPVTQPVAASHRFVLLAAHGKQLSLVGLDTRTGKTKWSKPATPSEVTPGVLAEIVASKSRVMFLAGTGDTARLTAVNAANGHVVWRSQSAHFTDWPSTCADQPTAICLSASRTRFGQSRLLRFDAATGHLLPVPPLGGAGSRAVGPDLLDSGGRHPEKLRAVNGSHTTWIRPLRSIYKFAGASTDWGWDFDRVAKAGVFVGSVGAPAKHSGTHYTYRLDQTATAGFTINHGRVSWYNNGSSYFCQFLTCPGASPSLNSIVGAPASAPTVGLRTRTRGTFGGVTGHRGTLSKHADVVLEGFDPASGHTSWKFDGGRSSQLALPNGLPPQTDASTVVLRAKIGGLRAVNLQTGATSAPPASGVAWCRKLLSYHTSLGYYNGQTYLHIRNGQYSLYPCKANGHATKNPASVAGYVGGLGTASDGLIAWSDKTYVAARPSQ